MNLSQFLHPGVTRLGRFFNPRGFEKNISLSFGVWMSLVGGFWLREFGVCVCGRGWLCEFGVVYESLVGFLVEQV